MNRTLVFLLALVALSDFCDPLICAGQERKPVKGFQPTQQEKHFSADSKWNLAWGEGEFTEGPAVAQDGSVFFSDLGNRILKYDPQTGSTKVFRDPSRRSNGLFFRKDGALVICEGATEGGGRKVSVTDPNGKESVLVDRFQNKKLNSPNDLFITGTGNIFFTDPRYRGDEPLELGFQGVFRVSPDGKTVLATSTLTRPNGILINATESKAFVAENNPTGNRHLVAFDLNTKGQFSNPKVLFDFGQVRGIDGMCFDQQGNIYATAGDKLHSGVYVFSQTGKHLAFQPTPGPPTNCTFGKGKLAKRLYLTSANSIPVDDTRPKYGLYYLDVN